jgi:AAA+ superfamily predicted ATPase
MELNESSSSDREYFSINHDNDSALLQDEALRNNIAAINADIAQLRRLFDFRVAESVNALSNDELNFQFSWPSHDPASGPYASMVHDLSIPERILLLCSLLPHYSPKELRELAKPIQDGLIITNPQVGGYIKRSSLLFIPSLETALFLSAGPDLEAQQLAYRRIIFDSPLMKRQIITLTSFNTNEPTISDNELIPELAEEYVHYLRHGRAPRPDFGKNFPAKLLRTGKTWDQLVLNEPTKKAINLLIDWVEHGQSLTDDTKGYFGPGYPALFYGPPGTGKSMTAALIGKQCELNVFRVDASRVVSKYIGETEKNLVQLFERMKVENARPGKKPILFFDEADVLFSKRTEVKDAKDKWANMETSVLLPLIEEYDGLVIVATNLEHNLDEAMDRRFQLKIKFPTPSYKERVEIWKQGLPPAFSYPSPNAHIQLARYKLSPAAIINILKGGCLQARKRGSAVISGKDMEYYVKLEFGKTGITPVWENNMESKPEISKA